MGKFQAAALQIIALEMMMITMRRGFVSVGLHRWVGRRTEKTVAVHEDDRRGFHDEIRVVELRNKESGDCS